MALNYVSVPEKDFSKGINQLASEDNIPQGFVEDALNVDVGADGLVSKRAGYVSHLGTFPVRVAKVETKVSPSPLVCFTLTSANLLDNDVDLSSIAETPILVYGRTSTTAAAFDGITTSGRNAQWYNTFTANPRVTFPALTTTSTSILASESNVTSSRVFLGLWQSSSPTNKDGSVVFSQTSSINSSTLAISYTVDNQTSSPIDAFPYYKEVSSVVGQGYAGSHSGSILNIPFATHQISSTNIIIRVYEAATPTRSEVIPDSITIDGTTADVQITLTASSIYYVVMEAAPTDATFTGSLQVVGTTTVILPKPSQDFIFLDVYTVSGTTLTKVLPDEVSISSDPEALTVTFQNSSGDSYIICYAGVNQRVITLCVEPYGSISAGVDTAPEIVIYGLPTEQMYPVSSNPRNNWLTHIDSYTASNVDTTQRLLITGRNNTFFTEQSYNESFKMLQALPALSSRLEDGPTTVGPAFIDAADTSSRSRGYFSFVGGGEGYASILSIVYVSGTSYNVTLSTPSLSQVGASPITIAASAFSASDSLTIEEAELSMHNGTFSIEAVTVTANTLTLRINNPKAILGADLNCGASGQAGVFSDFLKATARWLPAVGDTLSADSIPAGVLPTFRGATALSYFFDGFIEECTIPALQPLHLKHTGQCFSLVKVLTSINEFSNVDGRTPTVGQMLRYVDTLSSYPHPFEVQDVSPLSFTFTSFTISNEKGIGSVGPSDLLKLRTLREGQKVFLSNLGVYQGEYTISAISLEEIFFTMPGVPAGSPANVTLESVFSLAEEVSIQSDSFNRNYFQQEGMWIPIEKPEINTTVHSAIKPTLTKHLQAFGGGQQPFVRSVTSSDNMYLTNGSDQVLKFDGSAIHNAGIFQWSPTAAIWTYNDGNSAIEGTSGGNNLTYAYYFRLSFVDQQGNEVISAISNRTDYVVTLTNSPHTTWTIRLKLTKPPLFGNYEWDRCFLSVYRSVGVTTATPGTDFYEVKRQLLTFDGTPYIIVTDNFSNINLQASSRDDSNTAITGQANIFANDLRLPPRAKYITSWNNKIVLGNFLDYPALDLTFSNAQESLSTVVGREVLLKKSILDTQSNHSLPNRMKFTFTSSTGVAVTAISTTMTTATFTAAISPAASVGDFVYLFSSAAERQSTLRGYYQIQAVNGNDYTVKCSAATTNFTDLRVIHLANTIPIYTGTDDYNYDAKGNTTFNSSLLQFPVTFRLANAINACQSAVNTSIAGMETFEPWIVARAGGDVGSSKLLQLKQPTFSSLTPSIRVTQSGLELYANGIQVNSGEDVAIEAQRHSAEIILSVPGRPDTFRAEQISINADDGQEITGVVPFFGTSTAGQGSQDGKLVVFKTNSIYIVSEPDYSIQKIESYGQGCTAPFSIAATKDGIMFANESGIFKLTTNNTVEPIGQFLDRLWKEQVNTSLLSIMQGHHYGVARQYKLSLPVNDETTNSQVYAYNHTSESRGQYGSWTRYSNHPSTGWCNLLGDAFFASSLGKVFRLRKSNTKYDYIDGASSPINAQLTLRATSFGEESTRKRLLHLTCTFRTPKAGEVNLSLLGTSVSVATDLKEDFQSTQIYNTQGRTTLTGLSDLPLVKGDSLRYSISTSKAAFFQVRIENASLYEPMELSGVVYRVAGLTSKGATTAKETVK